jgi:mannose-6-phosphate isomerase-like protein (cupin superfamily)
MMPELRPWTRQEMMKRVAFFKDLKGSKGGLPDSDLPECERELINVIGFQPPKEESAAVSPVGAESSRNSAIPISEGFNLGFARAKPGCGPLMHNHNTNETFMPITGRWRVAWNEGSDYAFVDVGPCDVVSFPPGAARRFFNVTEGEPGVEHVLLFIVAGNAPEAAYTPEATKRINEYHDGVGAVSHRGVQRKLLRPVGD